MNYNFQYYISRQHIVCVLTFDRFTDTVQVCELEGVVNVPQVSLHLHGVVITELQTDTGRHQLPEVQAERQNKHRLVRDSDNLTHKTKFKGGKKG